MLRADRCDIARELFWGNGHLHSPCDRLSLDLAAGLSADSDLFLDIGAYTGLFALAVARQNGHIRCGAFEIVPENFQLMWQNTIANNLVTRVMPKLLGIGACNGSVKVPSSLGCGTLASSVALDSEAPDGVTIPVAVLDDLYAEFNGKMVIKIDVEGFEWQVFHGGQELLRRVRPDIVSEILRKAPKVPEMQDFLHSVGYRIFHITSSGLVLSKNILPVKNERDWLFTIRTSEELKALGYSVLDES
jgi:FkbM family methyltransferase